MSREFVTVRGAPTAVSVRVLAVDAFVRARHVANVDLVKIDTESTEPDVLRGMSEVLQRDRPVIVTEVLGTGDTGPALETILKPHDYCYYALRRNGAAEVRHITPDPASRNHLFVPAEKARLIADIR